MNEKTKHILIYGVYLGLVNIAISVIAYVFDLAFISMWSGMLIGIVTLIISIALLVVLGRKIRDKYYDGFIKYSKALLNAFIMVIVLAFISNMYSYAFHKWIDPEYQETSKIVIAERTAQSLYERGMSDKEIDKITDSILDRETPSAEKTAAMGFGGTLIFGLIYSLIAAAMIKKNPEIFQDENLITDTEA
jgi:ABC-type multidrug transport system fused ATPase/permease subunit